MKHFVFLDDTTFEFLIRLKAQNTFWYLSLISCAKVNPKLAQKCINEIFKELKWAKMPELFVNPFQICKAVNSGLVTPTAFKSISNSAWLVWREVALLQIKEKPISVIK